MSEEITWWIVGMCALFVWMGIPIALLIQVRGMSKMDKELEESRKAWAKQMEKVHYPRSVLDSVAGKKRRRYEKFNEEAQAHEGFNEATQGEQ